MRGKEWRKHVEPWGRKWEEGNGKRQRSEKGKRPREGGPQGGRGGRKGAERPEIMELGRSEKNKVDFDTF